jgi:phosphoglucosamine mutase
VPQALINVANDHYDDAVVREIFAELVAQFGLDPNELRLLVRPSGTEPVVRVMIEALDEGFVAAFASRIRTQFS